MKTQFIAWEFLKDRAPASTIGCFNSISEVEYILSGIYSIKYKNEPAYPYAMIQQEEIDEHGHRKTITYCYYGK